MKNKTLVLGLVLIVVLSAFDLVAAARTRCVRAGHDRRVITLSDLDVLWDTTLFNIDNVQTRRNQSTPQGPIVLRSPSSLMIRGWAVDREQRGPAIGVFAVVDGIATFRARYGIERPEVARRTGNPRYLQSGFEVAIPANVLAPGEHAVRFEVVAGDLTGYYAPHAYVSVDVR